MVFVAGLSCELTGLFSRMMHLDPAQRPTVADIMADLNVLLPSHQAGLAATCPTMLTGSREGVCWWLLHTCRYMLVRVAEVLSLLFTVIPSEFVTGPMSSCSELVQ